MRIITCIIQTANFWIENFEKYNQPTYIKEDVIFFTMLFTKLEKELNEFKKSNEVIMYMDDEENIKRMTKQKTKREISLLLKKCGYFKENADTIISDKTL